MKCWQRLVNWWRQDCSLDQWKCVFKKFKHIKEGCFVLEKLTFLGIQLFITQSAVTSGNKYLKEILRSPKQRTFSLIHSILHASHLPLKLLDRFITECLCLCIAMWVCVLFYFVLFFLQSPSIELCIYAFTGISYSNIQVSTQYQGHMVGSKS